MATVLILTKTSVERGLLGHAQPLSQARDSKKHRKNTSAQRSQAKMKDEVLAAKFVNEKAWRKLPAHHASRNKSGILPAQYQYPHFRITPQHIHLARCMISIYELIERHRKYILEVLLGSEVHQVVGKICAAECFKRSLEFQQHSTTLFPQYQRCFRSSCQQLSWS